MDGLDCLLARVGIRAGSPVRQIVMAGPMVPAVDDEKDIRELVELDLQCEGHTVLI